MPSLTNFDLCVIGAGPGGFAAATRAARAGARVCLIEARQLGGTCLNRGCIPARALGTTAWLAGLLRRASTLGIAVEESRVIWPQAVARKDRIVRRLREGLTQLAQSRQITLVFGRAVVVGPRRVEVQPTDGAAATVVEAKAVILATGSSPMPWPVAPFDGRRILSSDDLLQMTDLPSRLVVIGGGVVGCEFASYLAPLGVAVTLIERERQLLPGQDAELAQALAALLTKAGVRVQTGTAVTAVAVEAEEVVVRWASGEARADQVLVTIGRQPATQGLGLEVGRVDERLQTSTPGVFAIGDLLGQHQTAYTASYEGTVAAENALGGSRAVDYRVVPDCIFTLPEIATVGLTELQARQAGYQAAVSRVPWSVSARAMTLEETDGFIKVVYETTSQRLLGVQLIGPRATDLIAEAALALSHGLTLPAIVEVLHGHPTLSEGLWEASAQPLAQSLYVK